MATARAAIGTFLQVGDGASPEVFTTIANVGNIGGPAMAADMIEISTQDVVFKQFIACIRDGGEVTAMLYFDPTDAMHATGATSLLNTFNNGTKRNYQILISGTSPQNKWKFAAYVAKAQFKYDVNGPQSCDLAFRTTGQPVLS